MTFYLEDEEPTPRPAGELPISVTLEWFRGWDKGAETDFDDYCYRIVWADGSTETRHTVPNSWHAIKPANAKSPTLNDVAALVCADIVRSVA